MSNIQRGAKKTLTDETEQVTLGMKQSVMLSNVVFKKFEN